MCIFIKDQHMLSVHVLVVEDEVGPPHQAAGDVDHLQTIVVLFVPLQVRVVPSLPDPQVGDQHLVPLVLSDTQSQERSPAHTLTLGGRCKGGTA